MELLRLGGLLGNSCNGLIGLDLFFYFRRNCLLLLLVLLFLLINLLNLLNMVFRDGWDLSNNFMRLR